MFIELVDSLRCLNAHEDTWLVAAVTRMDGRRIVEGQLGCPQCRREYPIRDGIGWFTDPGSGQGWPHLTRRPSPAADDRVMRAGALLGLTDAGGIVVLGGAWADCASSIAELGPTHVVTLNDLPPSDAPEPVSCLVVEDKLPFATASIRAAALDDPRAAALLGSAADALRSRGRLVGPAGAAVPAGVIELARDAEHWVAERTVVASPPVTLRSTRR